MKRLSKAEKREERWFYLIISPWLLGFVFFSLGPMLISIYMSFTDWNMFEAPNFIGLKNYTKLFTADKRFLKSIYNTFYFAFISVPLNILASIFIAYFLDKKIKGIRFFRTIYYLPVLVPLTAVAFTFQWIFNSRIGIVNRVIGLFGVLGPSWLADARYIKMVIVFMSLWQVGGSLVLILAAMQGIPNELYESADIDGASRLKQYIKITIPMITPVLFFNLITGIIGALQVFTQSYILTGGVYQPNNSSLMISNYLYQKGFQDFQMGYAASIGWVLFVIIILFSLMVIRSSALWVFYEGEVKKG